MEAIEASASEGHLLSVAPIVGTYISEGGDLYTTVPEDTPLNGRIPTDRYTQQFVTASMRKNDAPLPSRRCMNCVIQ